jgi:diketogulonate reductase-like aldo/keto reductase
MKELVQVGSSDVVTALATKYSKSPAQISLRFLIEKGVAIIPNAHDAQYQRENLDLFTPGFAFTGAEVQKLGAIALICRKFCTTSNSSSYYCHKCWGDPADLMCGDASTGSMFHCP